MGFVGRNKVRRQHALRLLVEVDPLESRSLITESLGVAYSIAQLGSFRAGVFTNDPVVSKPPITSPVAKKTASFRPSGVPMAIPTASAPEAPATPVVVPSSPPAMQTPTGTEAEPADDGFVAPPTTASPGGGSAARGPVGSGQALSSPTSTPASRHAPVADNPASALSATTVTGASASPATTGVALNSPVAGRNTSSSSASALAPAAASTSISLTSAYAPIAPAAARCPVATPMLSSLSFTNFPLYTLDYNNGETLLPVASQYANLNGYVDLRAQTKSATGVTFSWNTSGLTDAKNITGASTYHLQFQWKNSSSGATDTVTLTATDSGGHQETQTYSFIVPSGSVFPWGSAPSISWPESISPDQALADTARFDSQNLSVDAYSGSVQTAIALSSYNPNVAPLVFSYDSLNADPRPMILEHHELDPSQSVPTKVGAQLTFNGVTGTTYYYATSAFSGGDIMQMALQGDATSLATGRYDYSIAVSDMRGSTTTTTASGTMTVLNGSSNAIGAGWTLNGLERITAASGGLILDLGSGDKSLWFSGSGTGTYTSPAGDFSTLVKNSTIPSRAR